MIVLVIFLSLLLCVFAYVAYQAYKQNQVIIKKNNHLIHNMDQINTYFVEGKFHIGDVLTACSDHMLSPKKEEGVRELVSYMTGKTVDMEDLVKETDRIIPELHKQFPWLAEIPFEDCNEGNWRQFRDEYAQKYGEYLNVNTIY
jgi:hypothetical protein